MYSDQMNPRYADRFVHRYTDGHFDDYTDTVITVGNAVWGGLQSFLEFHKRVYRRPGIQFTPEQEAKIRAFVQEGKTALAQQIILDELNKEFPDGKG